MRKFVLARLNSSELLNSIVDLCSQVETSLVPELLLIISKPMQSYPAPLNAAGTSSVEICDGVWSPSRRQEYSMRNPRIE